MLDHENAWAKGLWKFDEICRVCENVQNCTSIIDDVRLAYLELKASTDLITMLRGFSIVEFKDRFGMFWPS